MVRLVNGVMGYRGQKVSKVNLIRMNGLKLKFNYGKKTKNHNKFDPIRDTFHWKIYCKCFCLHKILSCKYQQVVPKCA